MILTYMLFDVYRNGVRESKVLGKEKISARESHGSD